MTVVHYIAKDAGIAIAETAADLSAIHRPDCAAALWQRAPLPAFQTWIDALDPQQLPNARVILSPNRVHEAVTQICDVSGTRDGGERAMLADDAAALADIFAGLMDAPYLRLRFDVVETNACRKFHVDSIVARLICTYRGTGTQYGNAFDGDEPEQFFTAPAGSPLVLRGKLWRPAPCYGLLHRSPPIEGTGETRLLLVLDPISDPDNHPEPKLIR